MVEISAIILTHFENNSLEKCINSINKIAEDIVVIDSYSHRDAEELCKKKEISYFQCKEEEHLIKVKWAIEKTKYFNILILFDNEVLSDKLKRSIQAVKNGWIYNAYYFKSLINYCGKKIRFCGVVPKKDIRLLDKRKVQWINSVKHNKLLIDNDSLSYLLKGKIHRYLYNNISQHIEQINKESEIIANNNFQNGKKVYLFIIFIRFVAIFFNRYFLKLGILDGYYGFIICILAAYNGFISDAKLWQLKKIK